MLMGRKKFAVLAFVTTLILTTPLSRLPQKRDRALISYLMAAIVFLVSVWPFLTPAFNRNQLAGLQTRINGDGVCLQNTDYTCGPAAAVTALRKLGLPAREGRSPSPPTRVLKPVRWRMSSLNHCKPNTAKMG